MRASVRLLRAGLYDEALNALRTGGEIVNLLLLFDRDLDLLARWRAADARDRFTLARPGRVIRELDTAGFAALDADRNDLMSRIAHGNTKDAPQSYNVLGMPLTGGSFQEAGFLVVLNEASLVTSLALFAGSRLIKLDRAVRQRLFDAGLALIESIGAINVASVREALASHARNDEGDKPESS